MTLIGSTMAYDAGIQAYRRAFLASGETMDGSGGLGRYERTRDWLDDVARLRRAETAPPHLVPATQYIYIRETDGKVVGMLQLRHRLNPYLAQYGGHIGYSVAPDERRRGYATQMLRDVLPECLRLGIHRVLITCVQGNEGSRRVILRNGGRFDCAVYDPDARLWFERYWIDL